MKLVIIHGSPRKSGNSSFLAGKMAEAFGDAEIYNYYLADMLFSGCKSCMACRKNAERCVLDDDAAPALEKITEADVTVIAAPIYFEHINGTTKSFYDRFFSFYSTDYFKRRSAGEVNIPTRLAAGKTAVLILTQGQAVDKYQGLGPLLSSELQHLGFTRVEVLRACELNSPKDILARQDLWEEARSLAKRIRGRY
jgi:multimeric flavodoxin WrbA